MAKKSVELTGAQATAVIAALDSYLEAGAWDEQLVIFGSASGITAAANARDALTPIAVAHYESEQRREERSRS